MRMSNYKEAKNIIMFIENDIRQVGNQTRFNSTQLNKPPRKVAHKKKEAHKSLIISLIL